MTSTYEHVPEELKERDQWVTWRYKRRGGKPTKVPYMPDGSSASHSDPDTWSPFPCVVQAFSTGKFAGVGYVFSKDDPYCGADFDHVRDPQSGAIEPETVEKLQRLGSYTEVSPSLKGLKVWLRGELPAGRRKKPGLEVYDRRRFFTVTGAFWPQAPLTIEFRQAELEELLREEFPEPKHKPRRPYAGPIGEQIDLLAFLEGAGVAILGEVPDGTAERVYRVICPWWADHTGGDKSGTRVGQYTDGALWFQCEHAHCSHRSWADFRELVCPSARLRLGRKVYARHREVISIAS